MAELLKKIPAETCWAVTAKFLTGLIILRGSKPIAPILGTGEGIISPVLGWEKWQEINNKVWVEGGKKFYPWVKETFNIPVKDAIGAAKLYVVAATLMCGPEATAEIVEENPERVMLRWAKCASYERYKDLEQDPELRVCPGSHPLWAGEGLKTIHPKLTFKLTKAMPKGAPYCEAIIEFKED